MYAIGDANPSKVFDSGVLQVFQISEYENDSDMNTERIGADLRIQRFVIPERNERPHSLRFSCIN